MRIRIPNNWSPRPYQLPFCQAFDSGTKRFLLEWHRRAGKDDACMHMTAKAAVARPANYWHLLPEYTQARKAIWEAVNPHTGKRRIDEVFPKEIRSKTREDEMMIELFNGSTWRLLGSDRYDSLVGAPPLGIVFSEYALSDPSSWDYLRPMLTENGGWAIFNSTVRGRNHFYQLAQYARTEPDWFYSGVDADSSGVFTKEQLQKELKELQAIHGHEEGEAIFRQEYYNDPNASLPGAIFAKVLTQMQRDGKITRVPYDPAIPVITAWDIGIRDSTVIWFAQTVGREVRIIDHYASSGADLVHYAKTVTEKPYMYYGHILPHDGGHENIRGGSVKTQLIQLGLRNVIVLPVGDLAAQIQTTRTFLPKCVFDQDKCRQGLDGLLAYHREWDEGLKKFKDKPKHDWASNHADAFRYLAVGYFAPQPMMSGPIKAQSAWSPYSL